MNIATLLFGAIVIIFAWRGYQKGFIGSITRLLSWLIAYPAAIFFTKPVAKLLIQNTPLNGIIVYFIAGTTVFLAVSIGVGILLNLLSRLIPDNEFTSTGSKLGGVSVGLVIGGVLGLLAVYTLSLIQKPATTPITAVASSEQLDPSQTDNQQDTLPAAPQLNQLALASDKFIEASAKKLIGAAAATAVDIALEDKTVSQVTKAFVEDPQTMLTHVQAMSNNGQLQALMNDEKIQSMLTTGDVNGLLQDKDFQALMDNPHMQALMAQSDVASETGAKAAAEKMVFAWGRVNSVKYDPRVIAIVNDPEFQEQLNAPNKFPLMMNPKLNQLTEIIFNADKDATGASNSPAASNRTEHYQIQDISDDKDTPPPQADLPDEENKPAAAIYRWTDKDGKVHYSDKPIKE